MPNLLAMSFEGNLAPTFQLRALREGARPDGWGLGFYPGGEPSAVVIKEPAPPEGGPRAALIEQWDHTFGSIFVVHVRRARWGSVSDANTQPFARSYAGRDWIFGHSGSLTAELERPEAVRFEPVGSTDTELAFCELLERFAAKGWRSLADADLGTVHGWFEEIGKLGDLTTVLCDGRDLAFYADPTGSGLWIYELRPPYAEVVMGDEDLVMDLTKRHGVVPRKGLIVSSTPLSPLSKLEAMWVPVAPGSLTVVRQGAITRIIETSPNQPGGVPFARMIVPPRPGRAEARRLIVTHRTVYSYENPVERSTHLLRLEPVHDRLQRLVDFDLRVSIEGRARGFEDVFGNRVRRYLIERPFSELVVEARSTIEVLDRDPLYGQPLHQRWTIPLGWMPWQRQILQPFLLPAELPETELLELTDYGMSFVERNDYDLLGTLLDMNQTIFREYRYQPGSTQLNTSAFRVYSARAGVCQDFTNLFISLARLLGIPARYVCGYIYCGPKNPNQVQSEASHAWVQVYIPEVGWRGFDPTNGVATQTDHVRVAVGRNYLDATPTSGTIYIGGDGTETLKVEVSVDDADRRR
jgi:transglutaminase-like putative cysteine protease/predicted glutamine amidotransferase